MHPAVAANRRGQLATWARRREQLPHLSRIFVLPLQIPRDSSFTTAGRRRRATRLAAAHTPIIFSAVPVLHLVGGRADPGKLEPRSSDSAPRPAI